MNEIESWKNPKYPSSKADEILIHVKRDNKGRLLRWHPCHYFSDHECSQDMNHILQGGWT